MSIPEAITGAGAAGNKPITGYQSLNTLSEERRVSLDTTKAYEARERMTRSLSVGEERGLIDATKDVAANLFNAFRNELKSAFDQIGIRGETAAELVRDISKSFVEAMRDGTSFAFSLISAAYKETIVDTGTSVSHALEFSANALSIEYNHATGELTADTSKLEIDAVKSIRSDNLPIEARALFDFTDADGPPSIAGIFDRVQQYLVENDFVEQLEETAQDFSLPDADETLYDSVLVNDARSDANAEDTETDVLADGAPFALPTGDRAALNSVTMQAIEEFTNARQETVTRMTFDLMIRVYMGKDDDSPEVDRVQHETNETMNIDA